MSKYPLIEAMGLKIDFDGLKHFIDPKDLEKALQDAQVWYGEPEYSWSTANIKSHTTHTARLVCIQPIKKKTKLDIALEYLREIESGNGLARDASKSEMLAYEAIIKILGMSE